MTQDDNNGDSNLRRSGRVETIIEYGLIAAGLAMVIVFGTQSISHGVRQAYLRAQSDPIATGSITPTQPKVNQSASQPGAMPAPRQ